MKALGVVALLVVCGACAPRADRHALLMDRAKRLNDATASAWVHGLQAAGERLFWGRAGCIACHRIGAQGTRFTGPNLGIDPLCAGDAKALTERDPVACRPVAERAAARHTGISALEYVVESLIDPDRVVTPTYAPKVMKRLEEPPVSLTDDEILALAAYVVGGACPKTADAIVQARAFIAPCRERRDTRAAIP